MTHSSSGHWTFHNGWRISWYIQRSDVLINEDEDDTTRLSELIALAEAGLQAEEAKDDTNRLSELSTLAEAGLQVEEAEDDTSRLSEHIALAEAGLQVEEDDDAFFTQAVEAAYYRR